MIFSRRDFNLVLITLGVLLAGLTYLLASPIFSKWSETAALRESLERQQSIAENILQRRGEWESRLEALRDRLPRYEAQEAVGAELLRRIRQLADANRVSTSRITPDAEENIGDLYEQSIEVTWEAALEPMVRFLYAVQMAGATLDIRSMTMAPSQGDQLKGNFKIFFAYQRTGLETEPEEASGK